MERIVNFAKKLNQEADATFRRRVAYLVAMSTLAMAGYHTWENLTFEQRYETATPEEKLKMLKPISEDKCSSLNALSGRTGLLSDNTWCLTRRDWASEQIRLIQEQMHEAER